MKPESIAEKKSEAEKSTQEASVPSDDEPSDHKPKEGDKKVNPDGQKVKWDGK